MVADELESIKRRIRERAVKLAPKDERAVPVPVKIVPPSWGQKNLHQAVAESMLRQKKAPAPEEYDLDDNTFLCKNCGGKLEPRGARRGVGRNLGKINPRYCCLSCELAGREAWTTLKKVLNRGLEYDDFGKAHDWLRRTFEEVGQGKGRNLSGSATSERVSKVLALVPNGIELSQLLSGRESWTGVISADITYFGHDEPFKHNEIMYVQVSDLWDHGEIHYLVAKTKNEEGKPQEGLILRRFLKDARDELAKLGIRPRVAVIDLERSLISAVEDTFTGIIVVGCYFHLLRRVGETNLPTFHMNRDVERLRKEAMKNPEDKKKLEDFSAMKEKLKRRQAIRGKVARIHQETEDQQEKLVEEIKALDRQGGPDRDENERIHATISEFLIDYEKGRFPCLSKIRRMGLTSVQFNWKRGDEEIDKLVTGPSNGLLEENMKDVNGFWRRKGGMNVPNLQGGINLLKFERRMKRVVGNIPGKFMFLGKACLQCRLGIHEDCDYRETKHKGRRNATRFWVAKHGCCCDGLPPMNPGVALRWFGPTATMNYQSQTQPVTH